MNPFKYRGCDIVPETLPQSILVGCNNSVNRYLKRVWRILFPDGTWIRTGTKKTARQYINLNGHSYGVVSC